MSQKAFLPKSAFMWLCCMKLCSTFLISPKPYSRCCVNRVTELVPSFVGKQSGISAKSFIYNDAITKFKSNRGMLCKRQMSTGVTTSTSQKTITVGVSDRANVMANGEPPVPLVLQLTGTIDRSLHIHCKVSLILIFCPRLKSDIYFRNSPSKLLSLSIIYSFSSYWSLFPLQM